MGERQAKTFGLDTAGLPEVVVPGRRCHNSWEISTCHIAPNHGL
jgi:hypothetical protein